MRSIKRDFLYLILLFITVYFIVIEFLFTKIENDVVSESGVARSFFWNRTTTTPFDQIEFFKKRFHRPTTVSFDDVMIKSANKAKFIFNSDLMVHLHIQKTSGMNWENYVYNHLMLKPNSKWIRACKRVTKRYICWRNSRSRSFYLDRYSLTKCDIHSSYSELERCVVDKYSSRALVHFITFLRNPIDRYISEFKHVRRGATWPKSVRMCTEQLLYKSKCEWKTNVTTLQEFIECPNNLANNRQVRMLANYNVIGCDVLKCMARGNNCTRDETSRNEETLLNNAKETLLGLSFFGLTEYQGFTQLLFENTYKSYLRFNEKLNSSSSVNHTLDGDVSSEYVNKIKRLNKLDIQLYEFAVEVFFERIKNVI